MQKSGSLATVTQPASGQNRSHPTWWQMSLIPTFVGAKAEDPYEAAASLDDTAYPEPGGVSQLDHL